MVLERSNPGQPHKGKVLLALQAHSDDIPLSAAGTVAKLIEEGYTGSLVRASNDDMGDVSLNALIGRIIFLIRLDKADTIVGWDP